METCPGFPTKPWLQYVQNSAARLLTRTKPWQHITPTLIHLHWLPVKCPGFSTKHSSSLTSLSMPSRPSTYRTSSVPTPLLGVCGPQTRACSPFPALASELLVTGRSVLRPPPHLECTSCKIRNAASLDIFKSSLKTHLFTMAFDP
ncbi:hypothetical protein OYC64_013179 [Pagothenia borchgrevinki]|uniref:Uncharacterized protein n=1 Tax=Pagothenia borchgrevinki TaxID=8213 RepID=A0ABD2FVA0_PAGBO